MRCFLNRPLIFRSSITLSTLWLASCGEQSQEPRCKELAGLLNNADWKSFAAAPFVETDRGEGHVWFRAPAKVLIEGFDSCEVTRIKFDPIASVDERFTYECLVNVSSPHGDDLLAAVKTFAAPWQSCFAGWKERSYFAYLDSKDPARGALAVVRYSKGDLRVTFSSDIDRMQSKPNRIRLEKDKPR